jgi:hypothetical protein
MGETWYERKVQGILNCPKCGKQSVFIPRPTINGGTEAICTKCHTVFSESEWDNAISKKRLAMKKRGRPRSSEPTREVQYRLRITPEEHKFLKEFSKSTGITMSQLVRDGVLSWRESLMLDQLYSPPRRNGKTKKVRKLQELLQKYCDAEEQNV